VALRECHPDRDAERWRSKEGEAVSIAATDDLEAIRAAVRQICAQFDGHYWQGLEPDSYPEQFVTALTEGGWLSALIPEAYGGAGLDLMAASAILEEINASGANAGACHAQMYIMGIILRHGSEDQRQRFLPELASGALRLQAFAVTEPGAGSDTAKIATTAKRTSDGYVVQGQKIWTSRAEHSDLMLLLARTSAPRDGKPTDGLSTFLVDMRAARDDGMTIRPIPTMINHSTTEVFFDDVKLPADALIGEEGQGFKQILTGMNAERILIAAECIGDGRFFIDRAVRYASERIVFDRPLGSNQGVQFPLAKAYASLQAADLMRIDAAQRYDAGLPAGPQANMAKLLASEASWAAANACLDTHGGFGFATEYDVERKFRETRLYSVAPVSNNLILAYIGQHVLGLPKSY
jgi:alkylation response protein AidB-like acyl-CoA dehydrogenase